MSDIEQVFTKKHRPAWQVISAICLIGLGLLKLVDLDRKFASAAAQDVVGPVEQRLELHAQKDAAEQEMWKDFMRRDERFKEKLEAKVNALCRANPKADCPLP